MFNLQGIDISEQRIGPTTLSAITSPDILSITRNILRSLPSGRNALIFWKVSLLDSRQFSVKHRLYRRRHMLRNRFTQDHLICQLRTSINSYSPRYDNIQYTAEW